VGQLPPAAQALLYDWYAAGWLQPAGGE